MREQAGRAGIPFLANVVRAEQEIANLIDRTGADTLISVQHPWVLAESLLQAVSMRAFNLHNAPLPSYRGHNAANHDSNGELEFAATIHWMAPEPDAGPIAFEERFSIREDETARLLHARAAEAGLAAFGRLADALAAGAEIRAVLSTRGAPSIPAIRSTGCADRASRRPRRARPQGARLLLPTLRTGLRGGRGAQASRGA